MRHRLNAIGAILLVAVASESVGCSKPKSGQKGTREDHAGTSSVGLKEPCVGLGCDGEVSVGLKETCVGMGCPPADAPKTE